MSSRLAFLAAMLLVAASGAACDSGQPAVAATTKPADEFEVLSVVFLEMLKSVDPQECAFIGVTVNGDLTGDTDPTPVLLEELRKSGKRVEPLSLKSSDDGKLRHAHDGTPGIAFGVTFIVWRDANTAVVQAERSRGGMHTSGTQYTLVRDPNGWRISKKSDT